MATKKTTRKRVAKVPAVRKLSSPDPKGVVAKGKRKAAKKAAKKKRTKKFDTTLDCSQNGQLDFRTYENLTPAARLRREQFVEAFFVDYNQMNAAIRIGIPEASASVQATRLMKEPYVQQLLHEFKLDFKKRCANLHNLILAGLFREANYYGPDANRVGAWNGLAKASGLVSSVINQDNSVTNNAVLVVPMGSSEDQWEQAATNSQKVLKDAVRV